MGNFYPVHVTLPTYEIIRERPGAPMANNNFLKNISNIIGELAIYRERRNYVVVEVQKIIIESKALTFILKPKRISNVTTSSLQPFRIDATFEYLTLHDWRFSCSIVGWALETETGRVSSLKYLISIGASKEALSAAYKSRRTVFRGNAEKLVSKLEILRRSIRDSEIILRSDLDFRGRSWTGPGIIVISDDRATRDKYIGFVGEIFSTAFAPQVGDLLRRIHGIFKRYEVYHSFSNAELWSAISSTSNPQAKEQSTRSLKQCDKLLCNAINYILSVSYWPENP